MVFANSYKRLSERILATRVSVGSGLSTGPAAIISKAFFLLIDTMVGHSPLDVAWSWSEDLMDEVNLTSSSWVFVQELLSA